MLVDGFLYQNNDKKARGACPKCGGYSTKIVYDYGVGCAAWKCAYCETKWEEFPKTWEVVSKKIKGSIL